MPAPEVPSAAPADSVDTPAGLPSAAGTTGRRRPGWVRALTAAVCLAVVAAVVLTRTSPWLKISPGPAPELTRALVSAQANPQLAHGGQLRFTTIAVDRLTWFGVVRCKISGCQTQLAPPSATTDDRAAQLAAQQDMQHSQDDAATVARALVGPAPAHPSAMLQVPTGDIGGPSAGLMLALAFTDALSDGDLTAGKVVAGTGTITTDGTVGPIAGITDKVAGAGRVHAQVFFAPADQAAAARQAAPAGMQVVAVRTAADAVAWLCAHGSSSSACATPSSGR